MSAYCCIELDLLLTLNHDARNHELNIYIYIYIYYYSICTYEVCYAYPLAPIIRKVLSPKDSMTSEMSCDRRYVLVLPSSRPLLLQKRSKFTTNFIFIPFSFYTFNFFKRFSIHKTACCIMWIAIVFYKENMSHTSRI